MQPRPVYADEDCDPDACLRLWRAVVLQAMADASGEIISVAELDHKAAKHFMLDQHSAWAMARDAVCINAGLDGDRVRSRFLQTQCRHRHVHATHRKR